MNLGVLGCDPTRRTHLIALSRHSRPLERPHCPPQQECSITTHGSLPRPFSLAAVQAISAFFVGHGFSRSFCVWCVHPCPLDEVKGWEGLLSSGMIPPLLPFLVDPLVASTFGLLPSSLITDLSRPSHVTTSFLPLHCNSPPFLPSLFIPRLLIHSPCALAPLPCANGCNHARRGARGSSQLRRCMKGKRMMRRRK